MELWGLGNGDRITLSHLETAINLTLALDGLVQLQFSSSEGRTWGTNKKILGWFLIRRRQQRLLRWHWRLSEAPVKFMILSVHDLVVIVGKAENMPHAGVWKTKTILCWRVYPWRAANPVLSTSVSADESLYHKCLRPWDFEKSSG